MVDPKEDGITHINVYSKGSTILGRLLSNFALSPFSHPKYGKFKSVEGFWYWLKTGKQHEELRKLYGFEAKKVGKNYDEVFCETFQEDILEAIRCKLRQNKETLRLLVESDLPLKHYYWYGYAEKPKVYELSEYQWMIDEIELIRFVCKDHKLTLDKTKT